MKTPLIFVESLKKGDKTKLELFNKSFNKTRNIFFFKAKPTLGFAILGKWAAPWASKSPEKKTENLNHQAKTTRKPHKTHQKITRKATNIYKHHIKQTRKPLEHHHQSSQKQRPEQLKAYSPRVAHPLTLPLSSWAPGWNGIEALTDRRPKNGKKPGKS